MEQYEKLPDSIAIEVTPGVKIRQCQLTTY
jgi:hypothetical protein